MVVRLFLYISKWFFHGPLAFNLLDSSLSVLMCTLPGTKISTVVSDHLVIGLTLGCTDPLSAISYQNRTQMVTLGPLLEAGRIIN